MENISTENSSIAGLSANRPRRLVRPTAANSSSDIQQPGTVQLIDDKENPKASLEFISGESPKSVRLGSAKSTTGKPEPKPHYTSIPRRSRLNKDSTSWKHEAELVYPVAEDWSDDAIFEYLVANVFTLPARPPSATNLFEVPCKHGTVKLPYRYRVPLLWTAKYLWVSVKLVMTATERQAEWEAYRLSILHVARLCATLLEKAHESALDEGMDKKWTCHTFDRVLVRFRRGYLMNDASTVELFWSLYGEEEYEANILKCHWGHWALKGQSGFHLTSLEISKGVSKDELLQGLRRKAGQWTWEVNTDAPVPAPFALQPLTSAPAIGETYPDFTFGFLGSLTPPPSESERVKQERPPSPKLLQTSVVRKESPKPEPKLLWSSDPVPSRLPPIPVEPSVPSSDVQPETGPLRPTVVVQPYHARCHPSQTRSLPLKMSDSNQNPPSKTPLRPDIPADIRPATSAAAVHDPSLSRCQAKIDLLREGIRFLREEHIRTEEEYLVLRRDHTVSQLELRTLKRKLEQPALEASRKRVALECGKQFSSTHPLLHLLDTDVPSDEEEQATEVSDVKPEPEIVFLGWSGPKSQRKLQKLYGA
ncbi:hypothetical protein C8J56DRAFT_964483 [Mycena floridula]|nr:hypothetical protein C8J56DRAFT_964483 [Mycena floridula]